MENYKPLGTPYIRLNRMAELFLEQALTQLKINTGTQHVWPSEIYPGFRLVNEERRKHGGWYSTGEGENSFEGKFLRRAGEKDTHLIMEVSYNDYLSYVDIGVGAGTKAEDVERGKKARYNQRYTNKWDRKEGRSHRPAMMMELRHLQTRLRNYLADYYGNKTYVKMLEAIPDVIDLSEILK